MWKDDGNGIILKRVWVLRFLVCCRWKNICTDFHGRAHAFGVGVGEGRFVHRRYFCVGKECGFVDVRDGWILYTFRAVGMPTAMRDRDGLVF